MGRHRCTSWAASTVIQSHAQRPPPYRRSVLDFGDISDLHPTGSTLKTIKLLCYCAHEYTTVDQYIRLKWGIWSESALPRGQWRLCLLLPSISPRRIPPRRLRALHRPAPGNAGSVDSIGWRYPGSLGRSRIHCWRGDVRGIHRFCQESTPKGEPGYSKKASLICREP